MTISNFEEAKNLTQQFTSKPSNEDLLKLYGLYKQATEGDNKTERPGGFDFKAAAKYNSWLNFKGTSKENAEASYISLVEELASKHLL
jgi:diazepam-binding inhibitor (GABA receptor modulating acyl-CoA-binding protein)